MSNGLVRDDLIVNGYIRRQQADIPKEIIDLCIKWYHMALFWEFFESSRVDIMNDDHTKPTIIKYKAGEEDYTSIYGSVIMPSMNNDEIYEYNIKFDKLDGVAIGICDAKFIKTDTFFYNNSQNASKHYALWCWNGRIRTSETSWYGNDYADKLTTNEVSEIKLTYDASNATISFKVNDKDYGVASKTFKSDDISYRLAIHIDASQDTTIELK